MFIRAKPKSANFGCMWLTTLLVNKMFSGFKSRCTMFLSCRYFTAPAISRNSLRAEASLKQPFSRMNWSKSPPSRNSMAMNNLSSVSNHSKKRMMPGCSKPISISASLCNDSWDSRLLWNWKNFFLSITLTAHFSLPGFFTWTPSRTSLKLPLPSVVRMSQLSRTHCSVTSRDDRSAAANIAALTRCASVPGDGTPGCAATTSVEVSISPFFPMLTPNSAEGSLPWSASLKM
mmetsp:Transcript_22271/g.63282  ORF Transcript_22271/g.63282 Transcript_22271/m.63282 type:complete len:232 (-) Transcript_22271:532-1227(-)